MNLDSSTINKYFNKAVAKIKRFPSFVFQEISEPKFSKLANYDLNGYKRIYFYHILKTGGTSINHMFLSLAADHPQQAYRQLYQRGDHRILIKGNIYVGWNRRLINRGNYLYAFSHHPAYNLYLPPNTFTFTCLRDPVKRVISHYKMLIEYQSKGMKHLLGDKETWLGNSFSDFIIRMPKEKLLHQLYMFSPEYCVDDAVERIIRCHHICFTDDFERSIRDLGKKLDLNLEPIHTRKASVEVEINESDISKLKFKLADEYLLLKQVREFMVTQSSI
jgi:hypothetical protein